MKNWKCSFCGSDAQYHSCYGGVHLYYCLQHWREKYVNFKGGFPVMGMDDERDDSVEVVSG